MATDIARKALASRVRALFAHGIFVSYRRDDAAPNALNIAQYLERAFCRGTVFIDIDRILSGQPFPQVLEKFLAKSRVMVVVIGPAWLDILRSRSDQSEDWVRLEINRAQAQGLVLIPVLVAGATLPQESELPSDLAPLVRQHAARVDHATFPKDMAGLTHDIRAGLGWLWGWPCWIKRTLAALSVIAVVAAAYEAIEPQQWSWPAFVSGGLRPACPGIEVTDGREPRCLPPTDGFSGLPVVRDCRDICPEMVVLPARSFVMGSPDRELERVENEGPQRTVRIAKPFAVARFPVTRAQFDVFAHETNHEIGNECSTYRNNQWEMEAGRNYRSPGFEQKDDHPVVCVNWTDADRFVAWLSAKTGKHYRLLSEAEREYATRAGSTTPFWWGNSVTTEHANYNGTFGYGGPPSGQWLRQTVPVRSLYFNHWGLYQMHGNVYDWVADCWHDSYRGAPSDGSARIEPGCTQRVVRGGSWFSRPKYLRSANRADRPFDRRINDIGFRLARAVDP